MTAPFARNSHLFQVHALEDSEPADMLKLAQRHEAAAQLHRQLHEKGFLHVQVWAHPENLGAFYLKAPVGYVEALVEGGVLDVEVLASESWTLAGLTAKALDAARLTAPLGGEQSLEEVYEEVVASDSMFRELNSAWLEVILEPYLSPEGTYRLGEDGD